LLARANGRALGEPGVPGFYTVDGLHRVVLPALPRALEAAEAERWVFGTVPQDRAADTRERLEAAVLALYARDYVRAWEAMLRAIVVSRPGSTPALLEALNLLGARRSPLRDLLTEVARQLSPALPPPPPTAYGPSEPTRRDPAAEPVARVVERHFRDLRDAVEGQQLDGMLGAIADVHAYLGGMEGSPGGVPPPLAPGGAMDPVWRLAALAQRSPDPPLRTWLASLAQAAGAAVGGSVREQIAIAGRERITARCLPVHRAGQGRHLVRVLLSGARPGASEREAQGQPARAPALLARLLGRGRVSAARHRRGVTAAEGRCDRAACIRVLRTAVG
jgi:type VI secretion system protein ImpL